MENTLYSRTLVSRRDSVDGETPTTLSVTKELNCWIVWLESYHTGTVALHVERHNRDKAIEKAVLWPVTGLPDGAMEGGGERHLTASMKICTPPATATVIAATLSFTW